ncbi:Lrp/AsnC family transcriptional regulator [Anianabacter salinae]|uniref:Lrp/AsnC family transcriptional regulator n=1 Tax=Anianabacter salinae TaxID=2851023 RepID=UPI00225DF383|nr:Lrp/AsnC family transcriptional regulator [Anianabacter salinae]MBV0911363.1 Lrp/AsnC family transcriptional regulator [Anianabacter salinae]
MDTLDRDILRALSDDARLSVAVLARRLGVARSTVQARIERLERDGTIAGYALRLGHAAEPLIRATVLLTIEPRAQGAVLSRIRAMPEVAKAVTTSGRVDLMIELAADSTARIDAVLDDLGAIPGVKASESLIHLSRKIDRPI